MATEHTKEVRAITAMQKEYGVTYSKARFALHQAVAQESLVEIGRRNIEQKEKAEANRVKVEVTEVKSKPAQLALAVAAPLKGDKGEDGEKGDTGDDGTVPDGAITIINDGESFVMITGSITSGVITLNFVWTTTVCPVPP